MIWQTAAWALEAIEEKGGKMDAAISQAMAGSGCPLRDLANVQHHVMGTLRNWHYLQHVLTLHLRKKPRPVLMRILLLAAHELLTSPLERHPKTVHFAVDLARKHCSPSEAGLANAVLRKLPAAFADTSAGRALLNIPDWLRRHWQDTFGAAATAAMGEWILQPAPIYLRCFATQPPAAAKQTDWPDFFRVDHLPRAAYLPLVQAGTAYIQDPMTRHPLNLCLPEPGMSALDLCAAPGGKSVWLRHTLGPQGTLVSVDLAGQRLERLKSNLAQVAGARSRVLAADLLQLNPLRLQAECGLSIFDRVVLDVPCSNTGVLRRKPDVLLRLRLADIEGLTALQLRMLNKAAGFLKPGGILIYSTCSIEPAENQGVVDAFLADHPNFRLLQQCHSLPWVDGCDGGAAFALGIAKGGPVD